MAAEQGDSWENPTNYKAWSLATETVHASKIVVGSKENIGKFGTRTEYKV